VIIDYLILEYLSCKIISIRLKGENFHWISSNIYPPSQKTMSLPVVECVIDRLLRRDVAHNLGG